MNKKYETPASIQKRLAVKEAIKKVAPQCKGNFEIPMTALNYINYGNRLRKKPVRASYDYVCNVMYEMFDNKEI